MQFPLATPPGPAESSRFHSVITENFVAVDGDCVRGGYMLSRFGALVEGEPREIQNIQLPLSEGTVDRKYSMIGLSLVKDAIRRAPLLYALGMGGLDMPFPKILKAMAFRLRAVPFWFRVLDAANFARDIQLLRTTSSRRWLLDFFSHLPLVPRAVPVFHTLRTRGGLLQGVSLEVVPRFEAWADDLWSECSAGYSLIAVRDAATLNWRLSPTDKRLHRIKITRGGQLQGWVVVTDNKLENHKQFGAMRLGAIVDALCMPGEEACTIAAAVRYLRERRADLIVTNQCAVTWNNALQQNGFLASGSNFIFAASPQLTDLVGGKDAGFERVQMNRCDGDGPIHL